MDASALDGGGAVRFEAATKRYPDGTLAVSELTLEVGAGELAMLVGPSGCGKTTSLKMVNRLVELSSGRVQVDGSDVTTLDPVALRRRIGYVIQQVGLFPHHTVLTNAMTVPLLLGWDKHKARERAAEMLDLVGLDPGTYGARYPSQLSGGQQQRVGVARALAADPPVLLMDEPFGAVDPIARERLQSEFLELHRRLRKTVLFVTHDVAEAVRLGTRIAVFRQGGILEQFADPATVLGAPASEFVADFVGRDRALTRLAVTPVDASRLEQPPVVAVTGEPLPAGRPLTGDAAYAMGVDGSGRLVGWLHRDDLADPAATPTLRSVDGLTVPSTASLQDALASVLQHDTGWVAVLDSGRYVGVLTPNSVYAELRRSVDQGAGPVPSPPAAQNSQ